MSAPAAVMANSVCMNEKVSNASSNTTTSTSLNIEVAIDKLKADTLAKNKNDVGQLCREDFDGGPISLDEIMPNLYLGNLTAATHMETLKHFKINHILTLDSVPLPQHIVQASFLRTKYVHIADMPKEDILHHLNGCVEFIENALVNKGTVLVHCYFGVSRSSTAVIAYVMKTQKLDYQAAFELVKSRRRFVHPNAGFVGQLRLWQRMGYQIDAGYQKYKTYRLRLAGEQVRKAKILPQSFHNVIKSDPAITQENPEPIVYRCRKCRRILACKSHLMTHQNKSNALAQEISSSNKSLSTNEQSENTNGSAMAAAAQAPRLLEQIAAQIRKASIGAHSSMHEDESTNNPCQSILFVEPIAWMKNIHHNTQGRLNCPKCEQKLGNFSWINGCQCPCGEEISPAFYLIPSKVELSKTVQNVQTTV